ncbi:zinc ribbon domain-containing protein [Nocardioides sp. LHD-245]|uniref:FmdB family zinc ribbon protein n=1 Tax=Nocardioides sp. LHD-245 TaxID=3051387 RepID=UPI0027DEDB54|nr:zinc ribbon domain-containing protein [Nocardioides sp. LHD-245]
MPTYQYLCTACGHAFEQVQKFSDDALTTCPECAGRLRKVFNSVGVVFKGSGFYKTDSKTDSKSSANGSSGSGGSGGSSDAPAASSSGSSGSSGSSDKSGSSSSSGSTGSSGSSSSTSAASSA